MFDSIDWSSLPMVTLAVALVLALGGTYLVLIPLYREAFPARAIRHPWPSPYRLVKAIRDHYREKHPHRPFRSHLPGHH